MEKRVISLEIGNIVPYCSLVIMSRENYTAEIKTRVTPSMREDFDILSEASGKKDAEFARDIYKEFLATKREELTALKDAAADSVPPAAKPVSYLKKKTSANPGLKLPKKKVKTLLPAEGHQRLGTSKGRQPPPGMAANE